MPRFDLMRGLIDGLRSKYKTDKSFIKAVQASVFGKGFYAEHAMNYADTLINERKG
ncbi:hypothetical protein [Aeromonas phage phiWae15]|nr:hypothetical protein [Aeromonas phage phiWae15]